MLRSFLPPPSLVILALALAVPGVSPSASAAVQNRISGAIASSSEDRQPIPHSVHPRAALATDLGAAAPATQLKGMTLRFSMTDAQQAALDTLLADQQNPSSPRFHQWLTPAQYAAQFGLSSADLATVTAWLKGQGFTVTEVANSGTYVRFNGTVAQAQAAFSTTIHSLSVGGETHFANLTDPSLPAALAGVVSGITGLHDFRLKSRMRSRVVKSSAVHTSFTSSVSGSHFVAPGDFYTIYNETPVLTNGLTGAGVSIAIMGQVDILLTDAAAFRTAAGLSVNAPSVVTYVSDPGAAASCSSSTSSNCPTPNQDDLAESSLDVEWAGATAPGAHIIFVNSPNVVSDSLTDAIDNNLAPIMSISYGDCESSWGTTEMNTLNQLFKQANAQGITIIGPSGDNGATDCDYGSTTATQGLAVDFPASSPYVTGMGGTMFNDGTATGGTSYWSASNSTFSAGTAVPAATYSATGYIPEAVWNEDTSGATFSAGGGGVSNFFAKPAWQKGTGVPADASRDVPDLALNSAAGHEGYLYCASGSCANGTFRASDGVSLTEGGGTSFATPSFAGILALIEQKTGSRIGNANPMLYALATSSAYNNTGAGSVFHDITTGNNNSPCTAGTPNCPGGGTIGYSAGTGYDLATGWGSINVYNLVSDWNLVTPLGVGTLGSAVSSTTVTASPTSVTAGQNVTFTATVTGSSGTPTGTVQFLVNNSAVGSPVTLSGGTATYTYATSCSTLSQQIVSASYSGDATYASSKGAGLTSSGSSTVSPIRVTVTSGSCPDFTITAASSSISVSTGSPSVSLTVAPANGFTGTVVFSASSTETSSTVPTLSFNPTSVTLNGSSATTTLTLSNVTAELRMPVHPARRGGGGLWYQAGSGVALAGLTLLVLPRRRRLGALLAVAFSVAALGGLSGCATGNTVLSTNTNSQAGTYTVTVTGTYTSSTNVSTSHSTTIVFTVK
ncbi:MAG: protease pro-enzyme activation domain-containing protein [Acidobacteriota bacterium]|nr:protease pro-enzyme activation domain-containing protein [Acidobacteriota bacterium]